MQDRVIVPVWLEKYQRWQVKVWIDGNRQTFSSSLPGRKGQQECAGKARNALKGLCNPTMKINKLYALFLEEVKERTNSTGNYTNLESIGRIWILPRVGVKQIQRLTEQDMQNVLNAAAKAGRSYKYISNIRGAFTAFLRFARKSHATTLHAEDLVIPKYAPQGKRQVFSSSDLEKLFSIATTSFRKQPCDEFYIHAFRFLVVTGLRPGELCELQRKRQETTGTLIVHGSFNRFGEHTSGKTKNAVREFILPQIGIQILQDQFAMLKQHGIISKYLFPDRDGDQLTSRELYKRLKKYEEVNGLTSISLYELRHTFVSMCKGTIPEALLKPFVGHSSKMPTYDTYGHTLDGEMVTVATLINSIYSGITKNGV